MKRWVLFSTLTDSFSLLTPYGLYFKCTRAMTSTAWWVLGAWTVWVSTCAPAILVHVCAAVQCAKGLGESKYRSAGVVIIKYSLSQSHHCSHSSETAEPITVKCDDDSSTNWKLFFRKCLNDSDMNKHHHKSAATHRSSLIVHQLVIIITVDIKHLHYIWWSCLYDASDQLYFRHNYNVSHLINDHIV